MIKLVIAAALVLSGCRHAVPREWRGIPAGQRSCSWQDHRGTCVTDSRAYLCIDDWQENLVACAPIVSPPLPPPSSPPAEQP